MLIRKGFQGMVLWPFIIVRSQSQLKDAVFINHERIHLRQQIEMLVLPFYIWYGVEFLLRWKQLKDKKKAYLNISFEREAYQNEKDPHYIKQRSFWSFYKYL